MKIDIHIHTTVGSGCSRILPDDIPTYLLRKKLDGVCITEHGNLEGFNVAEYLCKKYKILAFAGVEVRCKEGDVLVFGVQKCWWEGVSVEEVIEDAHKENGFVIACHPFRSSAPSLHERIFGIKGLDAIEVANGNCTASENKKAEEACKKMRLFPIAGSDAHIEEKIGSCFTFFTSVLKTEEEFLEALRRGNFSPYYF